MAKKPENRIIDITPTEVARHIGRPPSDFDLPSHWRDEILMEYEQGASDVEIMKLIRSLRPSRTFSKDLFNRWMDEDEEFSTSIKEGRMLAEAWWMKAGRVALLSENRFAYVGWYMNMKNRFGWRDTPVDDDPTRKELPAPIIQVLPPKLEEDE